MNPVGIDIKQPEIKSGLQSVKNSLSIVWCVQRIPKLNIAVVPIEINITSTTSACFFESFIVDL